MATKKPLCNYSGVIKELQAGDDVGASGVSTFTALTDAPATYITNGGKFVKVNAGETALEFATLAGGGDMLSTNNLSDVANAGTARTNLGLGTLATQSGTFSGTSSGTNTGDQSLAGLLVASDNLSDVLDAATARSNLGLGTLATQSGTFSGTTSGTNTGDQTLNGLLPTQTGNNGKVLQTDGANTSWETASGGLSQPQILARVQGYQ